MTKHKMIKLAKDYRKELKRYEEDNAHRPTRESRGREEAYKHAGELMEGLIDCWRWV